MTVELKNNLAVRMYPDGHGYSSVPFSRKRIFLLGGQSNAVGRDAVRVGVDDDYSAFAGRVFQYGYNSQTLTAATNPLDNYDEVANTTGFWLGFVREYIQTIPPGDEIIIICGARGDSGYSDGKWNPGDDYYESVITRANGCIGLIGEAAEFAGVLWAQGAADTGNANYVANITAMYNDLVARISGMTMDTPFLAASIGAHGNSSRVAVNTRIAQFCTNVGAAIYVDCEDLPVKADGVHWTAAGLETAGQRFAQSLTQV